MGRNPVYFFSFIIFFALSFPTAVVNDFGGLLALRFSHRFISSPVIKISGASITAPFYTPYTDLGGGCTPFGPGLPLAYDQWFRSYCQRMALASLRNRLDISSNGSILLILTPEAFSTTILLRRAQRLRKRTGVNNLPSQSEIDQKG